MPLLRDVCGKLGMDPKVLSQFLPCSFVIVLNPFEVLFQCSNNLDGTRDPLNLNGTEGKIYWWNPRHSIDSNLTPFRPVKLKYDHCSFCRCLYERVGVPTNAENESAPPFITTWDQVKDTLFRQL